MALVGRQLRAAREERGLSLEQVADALRINVLYLEALENELPHELPPGPFTRLYTTAYCDYLGLAVPPELLPDTRALQTPDIRIEPLEQEDRLRQRRMLQRIVLVLLGTILLAIGIWVAWQSFD